MPELSPWSWGDLPPEARALAAAWPALLLTAVFVLGLPVFAVRCFFRGVPRDPETIERGATLLVGYFLRHYFFWLVRPVFKLVLDSGVPAVALTGLSVLLGAGSGIAVSTGRFALGGWLFLVAGMLDALDGRVARARGEATTAGAAIDSILDRYTDSFLLCGLAWYYRDGAVLLAVLGALVGSALVPYVRARGESLGVPIRVGVMQRAERGGRHHDHGRDEQLHGGVALSFSGRSARGSLGCEAARCPEARPATHRAANRLSPARPVQFLRGHE
jgi:phosphatidylglycerophosphate synthase